MSATSDDPPEAQRTIVIGKGSSVGTNNALHTSKYNIITFFPIAIREQFRRNGNLYFLVMGCIMFLGTYTTLFESSVSPWTTLGPLAGVISISMCQQIAADLKRHRSDHVTNNAPVTVLRRADDPALIGKKGGNGGDDSGSISIGGSNHSAKLRKRNNKKKGRDTSILGGEDVDVKIFGTLNGQYRLDSPINSNVISSSDSGNPNPYASSSSNESPSKTSDLAKLSNPIPLPPQSPSAARNSRPGHYVPIAFATIRRMDVRAGDIVLVKNREMVPADMILLGSSGEKGAAYIETSPIDGETNLKLRNSPHLPVSSIPMSTPRFGGKGLSGSGPSKGLVLNRSDSNFGKDDYAHPNFESIERAVKRLTRMSLLGHPDGKSSLLNPNNPGPPLKEDDIPPPVNSKSSRRILKRQATQSHLQKKITSVDQYVSTLTTEPPNASVNTFSGKITLPPTNISEASIDIPLDAENILLRGAMLRNTEWVLGVACFTGEDTKLARNSIQTPSKFSRLDELMNRTVMLILLIFIACVAILSLYGNTQHKNRFDQLWYAGFAAEGTPWPYMQINGENVYPSFRTQAPTYYQFVLTYITLLNNFVPLSLYVTVEMITLFMMFMIGWDRTMYHAETDTPAVARSTTVTDLGQVKYVFSDKTGTLTQNVMCFKRCSVDGSIFGQPVVVPNPSENDDDGDASINDENMRTAYHDLDQLLVGSICLDLGSEQDVTSEASDDDDLSTDLLGSSDGSTNKNTNPNLSSHTNRSESPSDVVRSSGKSLTFNAEMFLRVMSICHTVVVEKEIDSSNIKNKKNHDKDGGGGVFGWRGITNRSRNNTGDFESLKQLPLGSIVEAQEQQSGTLIDVEGLETPTLGSINNIDGTQRSLASSVSERLGMSTDGSPVGFAYQAESPDEGALVSAASLEYGFQLLSRDSDGVKLSCNSPSLLSNSTLTEGLKNGELTPRILASETACPRIEHQPMNALKKTLTNWFNQTDALSSVGPTQEVWSILAVNKFDSTRKRMSVLVRSPPELGSVVMLLVKGADSAMLDPEICEGGEYITSGNLGDDNMNSIIQSRSFEDCPEDWEKHVLLNMQSQLGIFASEGLRTLVLGVRILSESESESWLSNYTEASTSIENRDAKLTAVAVEIETKVHIVGSTAIEDKLQDGVPETIYNIARAGIKLWVLTGDKRETAIEIGYSTKVLSPKMHLTDVADGNVARVKAMVAMEFIRLVKIGKLSAYQKNAKKKDSKCERFFAPIIYFFGTIGKCYKAVSIAYRRFYFTYVVTAGSLIRKEYSSKQLGAIDDEVFKEATKQEGRQKQVRDLAENILQEYKTTNEYVEEATFKRRKTASNLPPNKLTGIEEDCELPEVFHRASNANTILDINSGSLNSASIRGLSLMSMKSEDTMAPNAESQPVIDDDIMSLKSELPGKGQGNTKVFNKKKRSILEKLFAVDKDVRKGRLVRHLTKEKKAEFNSSFKILKQDSMTDLTDAINPEVDRALVIEGSALAHFLGDPLLEELLFAVASSCESVIACRVSPKQKALLVKLVKQFVVPTPVTLSIGDGANDVGMIQEAQVGVGISGLEGQQAVNSSDFAIAQFRFLEDLLLVHGRWNFMRLSKTVLFSFYKNAVLASLLILYSKDALFSGEPLFDMWALSTFNFVNGFGILFVGMFDRDVDKDYVKQNPILYAAGPNNEHMALRVTFRWIALTLIQANIIYFMTDIILTPGGTSSSAFKGLMARANPANPGDGDAGDLKVFGNIIFLILNWVLAAKVLYESSAIINGQWPALMGCFKRSKEGFFSRVAYTWHGIIWLCIGWNIFFIVTYDYIGTSGVSSFSPFVMVTHHTFGTRSISYMVVLIVFLSCQIVDVVGKVFSNMFYPSQTQIHREIQVLEYKKQKREEKRIQTSPDHEVEV